MSGCSTVSAQGLHIIWHLCLAVLAEVFCIHLQLCLWPVRQADYICISSTRFGIAAQTGFTRQAMSYRHIVWCRRRDMGVLAAAFIAIVAVMAEAAAWLLSG